MKSVFKYLFAKKAPQQFVGLQMPASEVIEKVFLKNGQNETNVTGTHCIVCQTPLHVAVSVNASQAQVLGSSSELIVKSGNSVLSITRLLFVCEVKVDDTSILIYKAVASSCFQFGLLYQYILLYRFQNKDKHSFADLKIQAALYSCPRDIIVVSFKNKEHYNIFPMNFKCYLPASDIHIFGLRSTNITLNKILEGKKIVVSDTGTADLKTIYSLGGHHSSSPPGIAQLPFAVKESELFKFPVPAFASSYKEIEIIGNYLLGSHMFFIGRVVNFKKLTEGKPALYNIHFFQFLKSGYAEAK